MNYIIHANGVSYANVKRQRPPGFIPIKALFIMILIVILTACFYFHSLAHTKAQQVNINVKNASFKSVARLIQQQTGYSFAINERFLRMAKPVTAVIKEKDLSEALPILFQEQPFGYHINGRIISLVSKESDNKIKYSQRTVHGRVTDSLGSPLEGVTIINRETGGKTMTDTKGDFRLENIPEGSLLEFRLLSYEPYEVTAQSETLNIVLKLVQSQIEEVIVNAGYYTVKDRERTGSISKVTSKQIERQPVNNVLQAIQANIPGAEVIQSTGMSGGGFTVQIRGRNSISQGNEPFYIVDGVPFPATSIAGTRDNSSTRGASPLASINPSDIESIEVLKDADATAIYGSRGANGVVLISTKRGKEGKPLITLQISQGISRVSQKVDLMNTQEYLAMRAEALENDNSSILESDYDLNGLWDSNRDIDWQKELIGGTAPETNIHGSFIGGTNNVSYLVGGAFYKAGSVFPGESLLKRSSANFSLQYTSDSKKLTAAFFANFSQLNNNTISSDITQFITLPPNYPKLLEEKGALNWENNTMYVNPIAELRRPYNSKTGNLVSNASIGYSIIPDLTLRANFGYTTMSRKEFSSEPLLTFSPALNYGPEKRRSFFVNNGTETWIVEGQANWRKELGAGNLDLLLGTTFQSSLTDGQEIRGTGYNSDALMSNIGSASLLTVGGRSYFQYRYAAIFGRLNYTLNKKYIINITGRRDGSSRFGHENRFANFGAIGAAWIITNEDFFRRNTSFLSFAKLRASYGSTGNDLIENYRYLELWRTYQSTYQSTSTIYPGQVANPDFAWEVNRKAEAALDISLFKERVQLSIGYYRNKSSNQLLDRPLPPSTGFESIQDNMDAVVSNRGWEVEFNSGIISNAMFSWNLSANLTAPENKLVSYPNLETSVLSSFYAVGYPLSIRKLYNTELDPQTGQYFAEDYDGSGTLNPEDRYVIKFAGREWYGGFQNSLNYKAFQLDILFQFVRQSGTGYLSNFGVPGRFSMVSPIYNQPVEVLNRWRNPGDSDVFQKYSATAVANTNYNLARNGGDFAVENASFIRLKNVSLAYNLPSHFLERAGLASTRIFVQGQNLLTFTNYKGLDPETQSSNRLPLLQTFVAGIQIAFEK